MIRLNRAVKNRSFVAIRSAFLQVQHRRKATLLSSSETRKIPSREEIIKRLKEEEEFDVLIIGAGATGSGAALDAAQRGLKVACIEKEDISSATSSRSTKLLWGGSRYLVQAFVSLLSSSLITSPVQTFKRFIDDFKMVMNCHRERRFMLLTQPHLTSWTPIAVPLDKWLLWPAPFNFPPAAIGPLGVFPIFFKFYDALSGFSCPPSHIMTKSRAKRKFPQLSIDNIKYCPVFYEGMHDDARTNLAIAQTAAIEGAAIANYCEAVDLLKEAPHASTGTGAGAGAGADSRYGGVSGSPARRVVGARVRDTVTGVEFNIRSKSVLLCGGPFTDELRRMEDPSAGSAVTGASGIHIVLPRYFAPEGMGLVDMNTSDGRFMFFLPWKGHVLVGTTDHRCKPTARPIPHESEIKWLLHEASKYISPEVQLRRQDVLSAWSGIRPLAVDPHSASTATASRDHVVSYNAATGVVFVSGGKWTTYREMAEDAVDRLIEVTPALQKSKRAPSRTLSTALVGLQGYSSNLKIRLIQQYDISHKVAKHLSTAYGGRAHDVLQIALEELSTSVAAASTADAAVSAASVTGTTGAEVKGLHADLADEFELESIVGENEAIETFIAPGYPFIEAEVVFAARYDWARHPEDFLARRTRLAFLNKVAAVRAIPRVVQLMGRELGWDYQQQRAELTRCIEYMRHFGGPRPAPAIAATATISTKPLNPKQQQQEQQLQREMNGSDTISEADAAETRHVRLATHADLKNAYKTISRGRRGTVGGKNTKGLNRAELRLVCELLDYPLTEEEIDDCLQNAATCKLKANASSAKSTAAGGGEGGTGGEMRQAAAVTVSLEEFAAWWNSERLNPGLQELRNSKMASVGQVEGAGTMFG